MGLALNEHWWRYDVLTDVTLTDLLDDSVQVHVSPLGLGYVVIRESFDGVHSVLPQRTLVEWKDFQGHARCSIGIHRETAVIGVCILPAGTLLAVTSDGQSLWKDPGQSGAVRHDIPGAFDFACHPDGTMAFLTDTNAFLLVDNGQSSLLKTPEIDASPSLWSLGVFDGHKCIVYECGRRLYRLYPEDDSPQCIQVNLATTPSSPTGKFDKLAISPNGAAIALLHGAQNVLLLRGFEFEQRRQMTSPMPHPKHMAFIDTEHMVFQDDTSVTIFNVTQEEISLRIPVSPHAKVQVLYGGDVLVLEPFECFLVSAMQSLDFVDDYLLGPALLMSPRQRSLVDFDRVAFFRRLGMFDEALGACQGDAAIRRDICTQRMLNSHHITWDDVLSNAEDIDPAIIARQVHPGDQRLATRIAEELMHPRDPEAALNLLVELEEYERATSLGDDKIAFLHTLKRHHILILPLVLKLNLLLQEAWKRAVEDFALARFLLVDAPGIDGGEDVELLEDLYTMDDRLDELALLYLDDINQPGNTQSSRIEHFLTKCRQLLPNLTWSSAAVRERLILTDLGRRCGLHPPWTVERTVTRLHEEGLQDDMAALQQVIGADVIERIIIAQRYPGMPKNDTPPPI
jgi:hypothetical protein